MITLPLASDLKLPLEAVTQKLAWLGLTGSGKTYGAMKLAELMLAAGAQIGAIDPVGVWRALRIPAPKGQSFEVVVFGGLYGDLPLQPTAGALIADVICDRGLSFVLDVSQMVPSEQQRVLRDFGSRLFQRKKAEPSAIHLFLEECQEYLPQNPMGEEALTLHAFQRLWKLGRNFGIGGSLISQRPQEINKKALNMSGTLFAFQMTGPQERKAVREWVADHGIAADIESHLQKLKTGEPHVESPTFLGVSKTIKILPRVTADLSSTPKVGAQTAARKPLTPIDVEQLKVSMAATIEKAKAEDPKALRAKIADLQRELNVAQRVTASKSPSVKEKRVEVPVLENQQLARIEKIIGHLHGFADKLESHACILVSALREVREAAKVTKPRANYSKIIPSQNESNKSTGSARLTDLPSGVQSRVQTSGNRPVDHSEPLPIGEQAILTAIGQYPNGATREQLTILTGYKRSSRDAYIQRLRTKEYVEVCADLLLITDAGRLALGPDFEPLPTGEALRSYWLNRLPDGERKIFEVLVENYPASIEREKLDEATGYKRSSRDAYLQRLKSRQLVELVGRGAVRASGELFA